MFVLEYTSGLISVWQLVNYKMSVLIELLPLEMFYHLVELTVHFVS